MLQFLFCFYLFGFIDSSFDYRLSGNICPYNIYFPLVRRRFTVLIIDPNYFDYIVFIQLKSVNTFRCFQRVILLSYECHCNTDYIRHLQIALTRAVTIITTKVNGILKENV